MSMKDSVRLLVAVLIFGVGLGGFVHYKLKGSDEVVATAAVRAMNVPPPVPVLRLPAGKDTNGKALVCYSARDEERVSAATSNQLGSAPLASAPRRVPAPF